MQLEPQALTHSEFFEMPQTNAQLLAVTVKYQTLTQAFLGVLFCGLFFFLPRNTHFSLSLAPIKTV